MPYPSFYLYVEKLIARFVEPTGSFSALPIITAFNCSILRAECHRESLQQRGHSCHQFEVVSFVIVCIPASTFCSASNQPCIHNNGVLLFFVLYFIVNRQCSYMSIPCVETGNQLLKWGSFYILLLISYSKMILSFILY